MTWTPDYKKDAARIKKSKINKIQTWQRNEISRDEKQSLVGHEETDVGDSIKPTQRIKDLSRKLHGMTTTRGHYGDLFLEIAELAIQGNIEVGKQREIGGIMLTKLRAKGLRPKEDK